MSEIINLNSKRPPVVYTVTIVHHYDDTLEFRIDGVADDERSREAVMSAFRRISGADEEIKKLRNDLRNAIFSESDYTKEIERQDVLLREENARLRAALSALAKHCNEMEAQNHDYHTMGEGGAPCLSKPLANAYAAIREGEKGDGKNN